MTKNGCSLPFTNMMIMRNGRVRVCCFNPDILGDLTTQSVSEVWHGNGYNDLRVNGCLVSHCPAMDVADKKVNVITSEQEAICNEPT